MISYLPKGLEWEQDKDSHLRKGESVWDSNIGGYHIHKQGKAWPLSLSRNGVSLLVQIENLDQAKVAAEAHHLQEWLKTAKPVEWISVWDRLPEDFGRYLVFNECVYIASFDGKGWRTEEPTHWLPLPSEPVEGKSPPTLENEGE
jgi:hypothetical protein